MALFNSSLNEGMLPYQRGEAKFVPLKKPNKLDYRLAKAWRPISLLATLGSRRISIKVGEKDRYLA